ncbi:DEBR0S2_20340g1_1 [Brettanomyces bruxellensis]|uniref:DEBR0S2_20340g1_1 n=1 Tax=Dekkera bruxellensis TaxID=5007 RepID=A0A7D9CYB4_DEKBR|nr:DEBR0S2_20340g1_1 [Brettanomyces bruxellensis]
MTLFSHGSIALPVTEGKRINPAWFFVAFAIILLFTTFRQFVHRPEPTPGICQYNNIRPHYYPNEHRINGRYKLFNPDDILLENATIIDGDGTVLHSMDLYLSKGTIIDIGHGLGRIYSKNVTSVSLDGRFVTPGLVDMHSHFGTRPQPQLYSTEDTNEFTNPVTPYVRAIDGIDPQDPDMDSLLASGVTTHLVLTGSRNLISGESYAIKMHHSPHNQVQELLVQYDLPEKMARNKPVRWMKMAYGENEKNWKLQRGDGYPVSRMGENAVVRGAFDEAKELKEKQDKWCVDPEYRKLNKEYPSNFKLNSLVDVLRGDINLNIHVYETYDMEALLRTADEYHFQINAFHHALSSWEIPELLKSHNTTIALFADSWGEKKEQYQGTVYQAKLLSDAGIDVAIKTDHPAYPGQELLYYAQVAHNYGLSAEKTIASVTSIPARSIGLGHRIGYLRKGYDADIAIWKNHPLTLGTHPVEMIIDGEVKFNFSKIDMYPPETKLDVKQREKVSSPETCKVGLRDFLVTGVTHSLIPGFEEVNHENLTIAFVNGEANVINDTASISRLLENGLPVFSLKDGYVVPGAISVSPSLGLTEMVLEEDTSDGSVSGTEIIEAADGIHMDGLMIDRLRRVGVSKAVTAPIGNSFLKGVSTYIDMSNHGSLDDTILKRDVAIHFNIGRTAKKESDSSISSQFKHLRDFLINKPLKYKDLPIAVHTHNAEIMKHIISMKRNEFPEEKFVVVGGQEAYLIADELAEVHIPVIVAPWRCTAKFWDNRMCSPNEPLESKSSLQILQDAGVKFALGQEADPIARRTYWDAGWAARTIRGYGLKEASGLISANIEEIFNLPKNNDITIFEHDPFDYGSFLAISLERGEVTQCFPEVEEPKIGDELFH